MIIDAATNYGYAVAGGSLDRPAISTAYMKGAEWADENPKDEMVSLNDICGWIDQNISSAYVYLEDERLFSNELISLLRKDMEKK